MQALTVKYGDMDLILIVWVIYFFSRKPKAETLR